MQRLALIFLVPAIALLAGCDRFQSFTDSEGNQATVTQNGDTTAVEVEGADGSTAQIAFGGAEVPLPEDLPEDIPILSEATVLGTTVASEGTMVALETASKPEAAIKFYEEQLRANDWEIRDDTRIPQGAIFTATKEEGRNVNISISGSDEGGAIITITMATPQG